MFPSFCFFKVNEKSVQVHCPQGWQTYQGSVSCYKMINKVSNWIDARKACVSIGGDLVTITSARENAYVARLGQTYSNKGTLLWIGLHRDSFMSLDSTKKFKWVDGSALSGQYSKWNANEPNSVAEECGMMYLTKQHGSLWNDSHCHSKYLIMCEKDRK
ncbi:hypothetical protein QZH41_016477 [Actinostola sp. cb2023]|nr:hypothetical protein QZH41_016477 [Actinostola sp. cb2023]